MATRFQPARGSAVMGAIARGPTGTAATVAVGTVTALAAGATPTVSNSGTSAAATFNFGIPRGAEAGIKWLYDSSTSMADPGTGDMRFNNATLSSVTAIAVSATGSGSDVSDFVAAWDNSTNPTPAYIMIREEAGAVAAIFSLSAVTDNTDWLQLTVAYVSGSLSLTALDPLYVSPWIVGNKGNDGSGTFPGSSTDDAIVRFNGTAGTTVQDSVVTVADTTGTMISSGGGNLGSGAAPWGSVFLGSAGVLNFNNGDVTVTHSSNALAFAGASSGYTFDAVISPASSDGAALGSTTLMWSDLFLASGGVINFNNGDVTITHSSNTLAFAGASSGYSFDAVVSVAGLTSTAALKEAVVALSDGATPALDASLGNIFTLAAAGNRTIAVPSNPTSGQKIIIRHLASGGARTLALNSGAGGFRFGTDVTALTATESGKYDYIGCVYNSTDSKWDVVAYAKGYG